jgi:hypothetical protein
VVDIFAISLDRVAAGIDAGEDRTGYTFSRGNGMGVNIDTSSSFVIFFH